MAHLTNANLDDVVQLVTTTTIHGVYELAQLKHWQKGAMIAIAHMMCLSHKMTIRRQVRRVELCVDIY